ncbi:MAG: tetratricopeptide repeat protein [Candidatus Melainabacteria bacterium]|nr:tetratricopeptide repeat protein [Candidatus Melainabacteria bacterium]
MTSWEQHILEAQRAADSAELDTAETHLHQAMTMADELEPNDKRRFLAREMLADLRQRQGRVNDAEPLLQQALDVRKLRYGAFHQRYAEGLQNLASYYFENERFADAEQLSRMVLKILEKLSGAESEEAGHVAGQLADTLHELGNFQDAEALYVRAIRIRKNVAGPADPEGVYLIQRYAALLEEIGRDDEAAHMRASAQGKISGIIKALKPIVE